MNGKKLVTGVACIVGGILLILLSGATIGTVLFPLMRLGGVVAILVGIVMLSLAAAKPKAAARTSGMAAAGDDALDAKLRAFKNTRRIFAILAAVFVVLTILPVVLDAGLPSALVFIFFFAAIAMVALYMLYSAKIKAFVADNIVRGALESVFDEVVYSPTKHIADHHIHAARMGLPAFDRVEGDDHVVGKYQGMQIEMSDIRLVVEERKTDDEGNETRQDRDVFAGLWLICEFGKALSADMRLWPAGAIRIGDPGIVTDNETFNRHFRVESDIPEEAFYILTPHMMEYILSVQGKTNGGLHMCFTREGKVQIAINSGRDAFEVGTKTDAAHLREQFVGEIRYVTGIIDELRLLDTLYQV